MARSVDQHCSDQSHGCLMGGGESKSELPSPRDGKRNDRAWMFMIFTRVLSGAYLAHLAATQVLYSSGRRTVHEQKQTLRSPQTQNDQQSIGQKDFLD